MIIYLLYIIEFNYVLIQKNMLIYFLQFLLTRFLKQLNLIFLDDYKVQDDMIYLPFIISFGANV